MFLLSSARWFDICIFVGLYEQLSSHFFFLRKFSSMKKPSMFLFIDKSLDGKSSLMYNKIPLPFPFKKNWLRGKLSSSFVSDIISISMFPFTWWARKSNLFLIELIFRWPTTILFKFLIRRYLRPALVIWSTISLHSKLGKLKKLLYQYLLFNYFQWVKYSCSFQPCFACGESNN